LEDEDEPEEVVKVMVVEDNMVNRKILVKILTSKLANQSNKLVSSAIFLCESVLIISQSKCSRRQMDMRLWNCSERLLVQLLVCC